MPVRFGLALVVNVEVEVDVAVEQPVEVTAIAVMFTTFKVPAVARAEVVNVPVPGEPAVKVIEAVVDDTVLVPDTL
jgi:hypothetical protein